MAKHTCCARCNGGGQVASQVTCSECAGHPFVNLDGVTMVCEHCHGTGKQNLPCPECADHSHH